MYLCIHASSCKKTDNSCGAPLTVKNPQFTSKQPAFADALLLLAALCRSLIGSWRLLLLLLPLLLQLSSACGNGTGKALSSGAPDRGRSLLPALHAWPKLPTLLRCHALQQLLLVKHLRCQLALQMQKASSAQPPALALDL